MLTLLSWQELYQQINRPKSVPDRRGFTTTTMQTASPVAQDVGFGAANTAFGLSFTEFGEVRC